MSQLVVVAKSPLHSKWLRGNFEHYRLFATIELGAGKMWRSLSCIGEAHFGRGRRIKVERKRAAAARLSQ